MTIAQGEFVAACRVLSATERDAERLLAASAHDLETALEALRRRAGAPLGAAAEAAACALVARCVRDRLARFPATARRAPRASLDEDAVGALPPGRTRSARLYRVQQEALLVDALAYYEARASEARGEARGAGSTGEAGSGPKAAASHVARAMQSMRRRLLEECPGAAPGDAPRAAAVLHTLDGAARRQAAYSMTAAVLANSADAATALLDGALAPRDLERGLPVGARVALCAGRADAANAFDVLVRLCSKLGHADALDALLGGGGMSRAVHGGVGGGDGGREGGEARVALDPLAALRSTRELHAASDGLLSGGRALRLSLEWRDGDGWSPLLVAVGAGTRGVVETLCSYGADVESEEAHGLKPLHLAAAAGSADVLRALLAAGADANSAPRRGSVRGETALHIAASRCDASAVAALLSAGGDARARAKDGATPLNRLRAAARGAGAADPSASVAQIEALLAGAARARE